MREEELARIEARAEAATPGPWAEGWSGGVTGESAVKLGGHIDKNLPMVSRPNAIHQSWRGQHEYIAEVVARTMTTADADFIAAARIDVPALVAEVRRLRAAHDRDRGTAS